MANAVVLETTEETLGGSSPSLRTNFMFKFEQEIDGKWFKIVSWGHKTHHIQLDSDDDGVVWLPDDPAEAARLLRKAADIIDTKLAPVIERYKSLLQGE
jgi:hypothetical protein